MKHVLLLAIALLGALSNSATAKPNVLFIVADDLNDWIGCLGGHPQAQTPCMDRLAKRGTLFVNAHCQAPLCNPSRVSFLTGRRPSKTGVYGLQPGLRKAPSLVDAVTLPQQFRRSGYYTYSSGKIFHTESLTEAERTNEFECYGRDPRWAFTSELPKLAHKITKLESPSTIMDWGVFPEHDSDHADWWIANDAIGAIKNAPTDKPFFIAVGFRQPHIPCFASQKWFDLYPDATLQLPPFRSDDRDDVPEFAWYLNWKIPEPRLSILRRLNEWHPLVRGYLATTSFMDSQVGRLLDALEATGRADKTIVVLTSDHGWHVGEKAVTGKNTLWERSTRVPLIFAGPGVASAGRSTQPVEMLDIYPTLSELCGLPAVADLDGHSLVEQLTDAQASRPWPAITTHSPGNHAVRSRRWRYIHYADGSEELYDMQSDPNEWANLAGDARYASVIAEHAQWLPKVDAPPAPGGTDRLLVNDGGVWMWEGKPIRPDEKVE
ncbi:MAG TPA: sulfatase [Pirellulales bacterium]|jgi:arylsulfatase A-like enzyme|nr:sulfatase [Pirellulales bacterium]